MFSESRGGGGGGEEGAGWLIGAVCLQEEEEEEEEEECDCVITWVKEKKKGKKLGLICWNRAGPKVHRSISYQVW